MEARDGQERVIELIAQAKDTARELKAEIKRLEKFSGLLWPQLKKGRKPYPPNEHSPREQEVFELVMQGRSNKEIADKLCILEASVKFHVTRIFRKAKVNSRSQLFAQVLEKRSPQELAIDKLPGDEQDAHLVLPFSRKD